MQNILENQIISDWMKQAIWWWN